MMVWVLAAVADESFKVPAVAVVEGPMENLSNDGEEVVETLDGGCGVSLVAPPGGDE